MNVLHQTVIPEHVALTRSLNELSIYILKEVEDKYTKKRIQDFFERYL